MFTPSSGAVIVLKGKGFSKSETFKRLEMSAMLQDAVKGQVIWIDEAGFLSVREMRWLLEFAESNTCRVVLSGDTKQNHAVEAWRCSPDLGNVRERSSKSDSIRFIASKCRPFLAGRLRSERRRVRARVR